MDPTNKAVRVANFAKNMIKELEVIANSCGAKEIRDLNRDHILIVDFDGKAKKIGD